MRLNRISIIFFILIFFEACSFQSKQYNLLKNIFDKKIGSPVPNWVIEWADASINVYAINTENRIYFAKKDDYFLEFDGWQITRAVGLLPNKAVAEITINNNKLTYMVNKAIVLTNDCKNWSVSTDALLNSMMYEQLCNVSGSNENYTNVIIINDDKRIIGLKYKIHPHYPSIQLRMSDYLDLEL